MSICSVAREVGCKQTVAADPRTSCCIWVVGIKRHVEIAGEEEQPGPRC